MKTTRTWKSVFAILLTLALLVGMVSVMGAFPAAAAETYTQTTEEMKFKADFSELTAIADKAGVTYSGGLYRPGITSAVDKEIDAWVKENFRLISGYCKNINRDYLGQSLNHLQTSLDKWSYDNFWYVANDGSIRHQTNQSGQIFRLVEALVPQYEGKDAVLSNFEVTLTFAELNTNWRSGILIGFHEETPAYYRAYGDYAMLNDSGSFVAFGNGEGSGKTSATPAIAFYDKNNTLGSDGATVLPSVCATVPNTNTPTNRVERDRLANENVNGESIGQAITAKTKYALTVRVVGKDVTATLANAATGEVLYTKTVEMEQAGSGHMSIGSSNSHHKFYSIEIQELDENGMPVAFGTETGTDEVETFKVDFTDIPGVVYADGVYYYDTDHATDEIPASYDSAAAGLTKGSTTYAIDTKDTVLVDYLTSKFNFYFVQEGTNSGRFFRRDNVNDFYKDADGNDIIEKIKAGHAESGTYTYISSGSVYTPDMGSAYGSATYIDGIGSSAKNRGVSTWTLYGNEWLTVHKKNFDGGTANGGDSEIYRRYDQMTVLDKDGKPASLKNFKLTMGFELKAQTKSNLAIAFRANTEAVHRNFNDRALFAISYNGGYILAGPNDTITKDDETTMVLTDHTAGGVNVRYPHTATTAPGTNACTLELTVVGDQMTAVVKDKNGNTIVNKTVTTNWLHEGFLTIGGSNDGAYYKDIEITRLDDNGNPVDFSDTGAGYEFGADFNNLVYLKTASGTMIGESTAADAKYPYNSSDTGDPWYMADKTASTVTNGKIVDYLNSKFDFYGSFEGTFCDDIGAAGKIVAGNYNNKWGINYYAGYGSYLCATCSKDSGEMMRDNATLVPKDENGEPYFAENVETTFDAFLPDDVMSSVQFSFRSDVVGRVIEGYNKYEAQKASVVINHRGVLFVDGAAKSTGSSDNAKPYRAPFNNSNYDAFTNANDAEIYVRVHIKVLGNQVAVKVTSLMDGSVLFDKTYTTTWLKGGYIGYTVFHNKSASFANINLRALAGNGQVVPFAECNEAQSSFVFDNPFNAKSNDLFPFGFTKQEEFGIPAYLQTKNNVNGQDYFNFGFDGQYFTHKNRKYAVADGYTLVAEGDVTVVKDADGNVVVSTEDYTVNAIGYTDETQATIQVSSNNAEMNALVKKFLDYGEDYLNARFDAYFVDTQSYKGASLSANNGGTEINGIYGNQWLQFKGLAATVDKTADPVDNHISLMVPKHYLNGEYIKASNFDMSFDVRLNDTSNFGTAYVVFNMPEAGNIGGAEVSNEVINFNSDLNAIKINKSQLQLWNGTEWVDLIPDGGYVGYNSYGTLKVNVKDGKLTGSMQFSGKSVQSFEADLTNTHEGYFAIGHNGGSVNFGAITIDIGFQAAKVANVAKTEGGKLTVEREVSDRAGLYKYVVTATPDADAQLKIGSLIGTDANGDKVYPTTRVGFRTDANGDSFYFYAAEDVTFDADFYVAHEVADMNVGNLGTSINEELFGLRFVSRIATATEDGVKYALIDGEKFELADYGMILTSRAALEWGAANGKGTALELNSDTPYIKPVSVKDANKYYDLCDEYMDISTSVVNLKKANATATELIACAYVSVKLADDTTATVYSDEFSDSYNENAQLLTTVYLDPDNGDDANAGTEDAPVATFAAAVKVAAYNATIVNKGNATLPGTFGSGEAGNTLTLTGGTYTIGSRHSTLNSPVTFENTTIQVPNYDNTEVWFAAGHKLVIKDTVTMNGHFDSLYGGVYQTVDLERTDLEIYAGNFHDIIGGSAKKYVAETHITVGGNVNAALRSEAEGGSHNVGIRGGGVEGADTGDTYITFGGNAYAYMIYGGTVQSGTISGDTHITMNGGECAQIFGACDRVNMTGNTYVTVTGGTVTRRIYGGCYNEDKSQSFHVTGNTSVTLGKGFEFSKTGQTNTSYGKIDAYEGIRAGSRASQNFNDEVSTLYFVDAAAQSAHSSNLGKSADALAVALMYSWPDTTDATVVLG